MVDAMGLPLTPMFEEAAVVSSFVVCTFSTGAVVPGIVAFISGA